MLLSNMDASLIFTLYSSGSFYLLIYIKWHKNLRIESGEALVELPSDLLHKQLFP